MYFTNEGTIKLSLVFNCETTRNLSHYQLFIAEQTRGKLILWSGSLHIAIENGQDEIDFQDNKRINIKLNIIIFLNLQIQIVK